MACFYSILFYFYINRADIQSLYNILLVEYTVVVLMASAWQKASSVWCLAEIRTRACLTASRRATVLSEPRRALSLRTISLSVSLFIYDVSLSAIVGKKTSKTVDPCFILLRATGLKLASKFILEFVVGEEGRRGVMNPGTRSVYISY